MFPNLKSLERIVHPSQWTWSAWRNGGGRSAVICTSDDVRNPEWRLSFAIIEDDARFSFWPEFARTMVLVDGGPLELKGAGWATNMHNRGSRVLFDGGEAVSASSKRRANVLNFMVRHDSLLSPMGPCHQGTLNIFYALTPCHVSTGSGYMALGANSTLITAHKAKVLDGQAISLSLDRIC